MCSHERECKSLGLDCSSQVRVVTCDANNENSPSNDNRNEKNMEYTRNMVVSRHKSEHPWVMRENKVRPRCAKEWVEVYVRLSAYKFKCRDRNNDGEHYHRVIEYT